MSVQTLAGQPVEVYLTGPDGRPQQRPLSPPERALAEAADARLRGAGVVPVGSVWVRAELNGGLSPRDPAYLYLLYQPPGGPGLEFWACTGRRDHLDTRRGLVTVAPPASPAAAPGGPDRPA